MPKGKTIGWTKTRCDQGGMYHWFLCPCGHRWDGASQRAKDLAWRLHKKKCEMAVDDLTNSELRPIQLEREHRGQTADEYVKMEKETEPGA